MFNYSLSIRTLGEKTSFVELDTPKMTEEEMANLEQQLNSKIRQGIKVFPTLYHDKDDLELKKARCRGLPDDHEGPVRMLTIEGVDSCLCCGTHVANLSDVQVTNRENNYLPPVYSKSLMYIMFLLLKLSVHT